MHHLLLFLFFLTLVALLLIFIIFLVVLLILVLIVLVLIEILKDVALRRPLKGILDVELHTLFGLGVVH